MRVRRGVLSLVLSLTLVLALFAGAPSANAVSLDKPTGGESGLSVPFEQFVNLGNAGIFVSPIRPAYLTFRSFAEGPILHLPVSGGAVESATMLGTVDHGGGMLIQKIDSQQGVVEAELEVTTLRIVNGNMLTGNALGLVPAPTADLINASHSKDPATGVIHYEADAQVNFLTATILNTYFSTSVFKGGMILGHLKSDIQTKPVLGL
jgi:hypothetical protein